MIKRVMEFLEGLKMTIISGIFLLISAIFMIFGFDVPIYLNPAWITVIVSGLPLLYLAITRLIFEKWVSSALLITIAMIASLSIGELFAAGEVAWIMALGALLEDWTVERAKKGLKNLINLTPQKGRKIINGKEEIVDVDEIKLNDTLRILPGETIPVDGVIIDGNTSVDQSVMTGESLPIDKKEKDKVFCGTMNLYGSIDIKATSIGEDSSLQKLINLVKEADNKQAPTQRIADKWATWLVPVALLIAIGAWIITGDVVRAITVLVVFCPCALILATPTAIMAAIGQATKHGVIIKSGEALEVLGGLSTLIFDKTGTLTYGKLEVSDIIPTEINLSKEDLLKLTASSELKSEHPLAKSIVSYAKDKNIELENPKDFKMYPGKGILASTSYGKILAGNAEFLSENNIKVTSEINTLLEMLRNEGKASIIIAKDSQTIGIIALSDVIREDASRIINRLHDMEINTVLLTGDHKKTADYFADKVGIKEVHGNLLPEDKLNWIEKLKGENNKVCMIGDGVNDAPALKRADVSIAMGGIGSDIAIDSADITLLGDDIGKIPYLKKISNTTLFTIKFNIGLSLVINAIAIVCSVLGLLNPVTGALVHNAGSCLVVINAALLYDRKFDKDLKEINKTPEKTVNNELEHIHMHYHDDIEHSHSHDNVEILNEIKTEKGIKHSHIHKHSYSRACEKYHNI